MIDSVRILLPTEQNTILAGRSLAHTLYTFPVTLFLEGELGAGKTTFLKALLAELGVEETVVSPTYTLEQRYRGRDGQDILHLDLYRLNEGQAEDLVRTSDEFSGIRCIEWADRLRNSTGHAEKALHLSFDVTEPERHLSVRFEDIPLPSRAHIDEWRHVLHVPSHIAAHCDAVADFACTCADLLLKQGNILRPLALRRAAEAHDILKLVEFKAQVTPAGFQATEKDEEVWKQWRERFAGFTHERACATFLREKGFESLGEMVRTHGLASDPPQTLEQKLLFYADKRVQETTVVTLRERFEDGARRYGNGVMSPFQQKWLAITQQMEAELFGRPPEV